MAREVVSIHVGQCGVQLGNQCWEVLGKEHGLLQAHGSHASDGSHDDKGLHAFFGEGEDDKHAKFVPRALLVDLEPSVVDAVRAGANRDLFDPALMLTGNEDAASNFARGHYTVGKGLVDAAMDKVHRLADACANLQGFVVYHAVGGGTGSGFAALLLERLAIDYGKKHKTALSVFPSPTVATAVVEPYNTVLTMPFLLEHTDVDVVLDNEAVYGVCKRGLGLGSPSYANLNAVVAQAVSSLTAPMRFGGDLNADLGELHTNLVPYPRLHFVVPALAPIASEFMARFHHFTTPQITSAAFDAANLLAKCDPHAPSSRYLAVCLMYRGDVVVKDVNASVAAVKSKPSLRFVAWNPTGFKQGVTRQKAAVPDGTHIAQTARSVLNLCNSTATSTVFSTACDKFDPLLAKRAFVWWYVQEGIEEGEFSEAREDLAALEMDFREVAFERL